MSYEIQYQCDGLDCSSIQESYIHEAPVTPCGWHEHDGFHYCPRCWPKIVEEMEEEDDND